jgi:hypothetical protein
MKVVELLKLLDNVKIDEDERHEIAEYLAQMFGDKEREQVFHYMTKDRKIYDFDSYKKLLESNKVSPDDAYVLIVNNYFAAYSSTSYYFCPLLDRDTVLVDAYLSKLGFKSKLYDIIPATGLRYVAAVYGFLDINRMVVEVVDINNVATNTNLPTLKHSGVRNKHIDDDEVGEITLRFSLQKLFAGHNMNEARDIINRYYEGNDTSLAKAVEAIRDAYNRIFQPYRVVYNLKSKRIIPWFERKLF